MSQLRTMVLSICVKWPMTCIITTIGAPLVVARHGEFSFVDYQDENGHLVLDLSNMWLLKPLTRNTTWILASPITTKYAQNLSHFEPVEKRSSFMKFVGYLDFDDFFVEVGVIQIGHFTKQMECNMIYQLSLTRSFFPNKFSFEPQHYLEDSNMSIFALIYTLELLELQLLKCSLANRFC